MLIGGTGETGMSERTIILEKNDIYFLTEVSRLNGELRVFFPREKSTLTESENDDDLQEFNVIVINNHNLVSLPWTEFKSTFAVLL